MSTVPSAAERSTLAWLNGLAGMLIFSGSLPATRIAVGSFTPLFLTSARAVIAAALAAALLSLLRQPRTVRGDLASLAIVALGVVVGFPLLTSFALTSTAASHGAVVIALLPAATATAAVLRGRERPPRTFWLITGVGAAAAIIFASLHSGGVGQLHWADLLLLGSVVAAAVGYAEGGLLARELGAWQTVSWGLVLASPLMLALTAVSVAQQPPAAAPAEWAAFAYLGVVSMFLGFFAWYRGLAIGPIAQVSQIQLIQPVLTIYWAALLLGETLTWPTAVGGLAVILCAGAAVRVRLKPAAPLAVPQPTRTLQPAKD